MQSPVGVPQGKSRIVGKAFRLLDILVQASETAIRILENKRMEGGMIGGSIKRFLCLPVGGYPVFLQFFLPQVHPFLFEAVESQPVQFLHVHLRSGGTDGRDGRFHDHLLPFPGCEREAGHQVLSPGLAVAPEPGCIIDHRLFILHEAQARQFSGKDSRKIDVAFRTPSFHQLIARDGRIVFHAQIGPFARLPKRMVHIDHDKGFFRLGIGETEHSAPQACRHLRLHAIVLQADGIIVRGGPFLVVRVPGAIALIGVLTASGFQLHLSGSGDKQEISQVGNTGPAKMRQAEP